MSKILSLLIIIISAQAFAQAPRVVTINVPNDQRIYIGKPVETVLELTVAPGYHIQGAKVDDEGVEPTKAEMKGPAGISVGPATFPFPKPFRMKETFTDLPTLSDKVLVQFIVTAPKALKPGPYTLTGALHYQACDSTQLFPPVSIPFSITVEAVRGTPPLTRRRAL